VLYVIDLWKVFVETSWGPKLDLAAFVLPFILGLVGVWVSIETPIVETYKQRVAWRAGLVIFGALVSFIAWEQQRIAREHANEQVEIAKQDQVTRYSPVGLLTYENHRLVFYNKSKSTIYLWGNKLDKGAKDIAAKPILVPIESFYAIPAENIEETSLKRIGANGEERLSYEMYFKNELGVKYVSSSTLLMIVKDSNIEVRAQMHSFEPHDW
jgi:hypothetical protein